MDDTKKNDEGDDADTILERTRKLYAFEESRSKKKGGASSEEGIRQIVRAGRVLERRARKVPGNLFLGLTLEKLFAGGRGEGPDIQALWGRGRGDHGAGGATANKVEKGTEVLLSRGGLIIRGHGEDVVAGGPLVIPRLALVSFSNRAIERRNHAGASTERSSWGCKSTLVVAVVAHVVPAM